MQGNSSLAGRAATAMALTFGFYALAILLGFGTIALPFIIAWFTGYILIKLVIICLIAGGTILIAILPHRDKFDPPGPLLKPEEHPRLFEILNQLAEKTGQAMPRFVYLLHDFNAWVAQRGGTGARGGTRMMGIGLPLLQQMSVSQMRAVLAHEFGHYHHGDTGFGAKIYQTRAAIGRTIEQLEDRDSWLQMPFKWYGRKFMQITQGISRNQEFHADRLAAEITGRKTMIDTLTELARKATAYQFYLQREFVPVVRTRLLPPLLDGFSLFLQSGFVQERLAEITEHELAESKAGKYDSHPSLSERIAALKELPDNAGQTDDRPALDLLDFSPELEQKLIRSVVGESEYAGLKPITWDDDTSAALFASWVNVIRPNRRIFRQMTAKEIPAFLADPTEYLKRAIGAEKYPEEVLIAILNELCGIVQTAFAALLLRHGFHMQRQLGEAPVMQRDGLVIEPFSLLNDFSEKKQTPELWEQLCEELGLADEPLFVEQPIPA